MTDALNIPIQVGDIILFPAPGMMMEAVVTRLIPGKYIDHINCKTTITGNTKKKRAEVCINKSKILTQFPEYQL
jgi:hypothetical protein